ncbi:MAG: hypothetical protein ACM3JD_17380 [Rudaea sp.]
MARVFYTEQDIQDLAKRGVKEIELNDDVYLTDLARERMESLGIKGRTAGAAPSAASRPMSAPPTGPAPGSLSEAERQQVFDKVRSGVIARLGPGIDAALVDRVVRQVVNRL